MTRRTAKKPIIPKVKKVLRRRPLFDLEVPKGRPVPIVAMDPDSGVVKIIPVSAARLKDKTWFERWFW